VEGFARIEHTPAMNPGRSMTPEAQVQIGRLGHRSVAPSAMAPSMGSGTA
jgi:hypothetical protein